VYVKVCDVCKMALTSLQTDFDYTLLPQKYTESTTAHTVFSALSTIFMVAELDVWLSYYLCKRCDKLQFANLFQLSTPAYG